MVTRKVIGLEEIKQILPHRWPMLLLDQAFWIEEPDGDGRELIGELTITSDHCDGHFPNKLIFPGFHTAEALAQAAGVLLAQKRTGALGNKIGVLMSAKGLKWRDAVVPGDVLKLKVSIIRDRGRVVTFTGQAFVGEKEVASLEEGMFGLIDRAAV